MLSKYGTSRSTQNEAGTSSGKTALHRLSGAKQGTRTYSWPPGLKRMKNCPDHGARIRPMRTSGSSARQTLRRKVGLVSCTAAVLLTAPAQAAEGWTDVASSLLERLTNSGAKLAYPGGCSGVVANRLNGE